MAHDKNPTEQLRTRIPATQSERSGVPSSGSDTSGNPWDALQAREDRWNPQDSWLPRPRRYNTMDWVYALVLLGIGAAVIGLVLLT